MAISPEARHAAAAYGWQAARLAPVAEGLINQTYAVEAADGAAPIAILQRLHPVFAPEVNLDIDAVTRHVADKGLETPRLIPAPDGALWIQVGGATWRALSYVPGVTRARLERPAQARSAGELVGAFHRAVSDFEHEFAFARAGAHDTAGHLARLAAEVAGSTGDDLTEARALGGDIAARARDLPALPELPARIAHGDLKISNVIFDAADGDRARCLIDLDTLGRLSIAYELGDALRSWCNPGGEDDPDTGLDLDIFEAALAGYADGAGAILTADEIDAIVPGLETICVELAARFCADAFEDRYFGWDPSRYPSRRAHNLARARGQLALARSVASRRADASAAARAALAG